MARCRHLLDKWLLARDAQIMRLETYGRLALMLVCGLLASCDPVTPGIKVDAAPPIPDAGVEATCEEYCQTVQDSCTDVPQYINETVCMGYCENFGEIPLGIIGDRSENTVACRIYHATVAVATASPEEHCPHAGPSGGDHCGSWCENYCYLALRNCNGPSKLYDSEDECVAACPDFSLDGDAGDDKGDTIQCRIHHLGLAGTEPPSSEQEFCPAGKVVNAFCTDI